MRSGVVAEFGTAEALLRAHESLRRAGYTRLTTWTPYPVKGVLERLPESIVPWVMLVAAVLGGGIGYLIQWWCNARSFPIDVGGRPLHSAPAFIPITFESAVLAASVTGFGLMVAACGMPRLHHPLFEVRGFDRAMVDRFWLGIDDADPRFAEQVEEELTSLGAIRCERLLGGPP
jgi:hypothetical protein